MLELIDTHCHIHSAQGGLDERDHTTKKWHEAGEKDPEAIIASAKAVGTTRLVCVGTDLADSQIAVDFAQNRSECWASVGIHPHEAKGFDIKNLSTIRSLLEKDKVVAVGEVGLDYYYEHSPKNQQIELLEAFLDIAQMTNLPVIFHVRDAYADFWPVFDNFQSAGQQIKGVLHSFTADTSVMDKALARGLHVGLNGIMTFTNDTQQITMAKSVPSNKLLLETDAPYLTPKPFRGKICKPEHVWLTAEFLAGLRGETLEQLAETTSSNAKQLFKFN